MSDEPWAALAARLRARIPELKAGLAELVEGVEAPREANDPAYLDYLDSLHGARTAILEFIAEAIERGERDTPDIPAALMGAARMAARARVPLDAVLRRYSAANAFVVDVLVAEAEQLEVSGSTLRRLLHRQATIFDRLLKAVSEEYAREAQSRPTGLAGWRHVYIEELLAGRQPSGEVALEYDLDAHHLGLMAKGERGDEAIRELARKLDRRLLVDRHADEAVWACWLGGRQRLGPEEVARALGNLMPSSLVVTLGEAGEGIAGWRLSHRQAKAALPIAEGQGQSVLRYADVAVLASILRDELGMTSLRQLYLEPLEATRDGGKVWRETLRAYFAAERNVSSTAAALSVDRRTVVNRIRAIEEIFGRPLNQLATDLETALRLAE